MGRLNYENPIFKFVGVFGFGIAIGFLLCTIYVSSKGTRIADLDRQQQLLTQELLTLQDSINRERERAEKIQTSIGQGEAGIDIARERIGQIQVGYEEDIARLQQSARILEQIRKRPAKEKPNP